MSFYSMRANYSEEELEELGIEDNLLATLLNPESKIRIGDNVFTIDMANESVLVKPYPKNDYDFTSKKSKRQFSIDDNVLDILDGTETDDIKKGWFKRRYCRASKKGYYEWKANGVTVKYKIVYQRSGIFKSLQAKIKKVNTWGGPVEIS